MMEILELGLVSLGEGPPGFECNDKLTFPVIFDDYDGPLEHSELNLG
jgi:hypothetical protein